MRRARSFKISNAPTASWLVMWRVEIVGSKWQLLVRGLAPFSDERRKGNIFCAIFSLMSALFQDVSCMSPYFPKEMNGLSTNARAIELNGTVDKETMPNTLTKYPFCTI